jgi:hypothetical protein
MGLTNPSVMVTPSDNGYYERKPIFNIQIGKCFDV